MEIIGYFLKPLFADCVCKYSGKRNAHQHIVQCNAGQYFRIYEPADSGCQRDTGKQNGQCLHTPTDPVQEPSGGKSRNKADDDRQKNHYRDHI